MKQARFEELAQKIKDSYESGVTLELAEKLAGEFLYAQIEVSEALKNLDLDSRMKKTGVKALRAAVYLEGVSKHEKKPSDTLLEAQVNSSREVMSAQDDLDSSEASRDELQNKFNIFREAHIHFRGISKGRFE